MNLLEFKRRLMTDPADRSEEMRAARAAGGEFAAEAEASDRFEAKLHQALNVPAPQASPKASSCATRWSRIRAGRAGRS